MQPSTLFPISYPSSPFLLSASNAPSPYSQLVPYPHVQAALPEGGARRAIPQDFDQAMAELYGLTVPPDVFQSGPPYHGQCWQSEK